MNIGSDLLQQLRQEDPHRYLICLYAPRSKRESLVAVSLLNVELARIRESVSDAMVGEVRLAWWREAIDDLYAGRVRKHAILEALARTDFCAHVSHAMTDSMIEARIDEIYDVSPMTIAMLDSHVGATAGQLQQAMALLLCDGVASAPTLKAAHNIGRAWGLIGVVRAVAFHAAQQRRYIPDDSLTTAGLSVEAMVQQPITAALAPALKSIVAHGLAALSAARALRSVVDPCARPALALGRLAEDYAARLAAKGYDPTGFDALGGELTRQWKLLWANATGRY